jgi:hypothetical protein
MKQRAMSSKTAAIVLPPTAPAIRAASESVECGAVDNLDAFAADIGAGRSDTVPREVAASVVTITTVCWNVVLGVVCGVTRAGQEGAIRQKHFGAAVSQN